jgi:hypothetical protein
MRSNLDIVASLGLAVGGAFGLAGTFVASAPLSETLWTIDGAALVVATALVTMKYQRLGNDCVAAGFLTFLVGGTLLLSGNAAGLEASDSAVCRRDLTLGDRSSHGQRTVDLCPQPFLILDPAEAPVNRPTRRHRTRIDIALRPAPLNPGHWGPGEHP